MFLSHGGFCIKYSVKISSRLMFSLREETTGLREKQRMDFLVMNMLPGPLLHITSH